MDTKRGIGVAFVILMVMGWVLLLPIQSGAETKNYKYYGWISSVMRTPVDDVEGHSMGSTVSSIIYVFEDGEVAPATVVTTWDMIKGSGPWNQYLTIKFSDGSYVIIKGQALQEATSSGEAEKAVVKNEFIKGAGRFLGIKGTAAGKMKFLPLEKGELGRKFYGEGSWNYTLPAK